jgi:hypothetical protein
MPSNKLRRPEPNTESATLSTKPSWSTRPTDRPEFARDLAKYLPKINAQYKQLIQYGAAHDRGQTVCASKAHIIAIIDKDFVTGTWSTPRIFAEDPADFEDDTTDSDDGSDDSKSVASGTSTKKKKKKTPSKPPSTPTSPPTSPRKLSRSILKRYKVDPTLLKKLDLEMANDIASCYSHEETGNEDVAEADYSGRQLLQALSTPLTDADGHTDGNPIDKLQAIDRAGFSTPTLVEFNDFRTELRLANELVAPTPVAFTLLLFSLASCFAQAKPGKLNRAR